MQAKKMKRSSIFAIAITLVLVIALAVYIAFSFGDTKVSREMEVSEAQKLVEDAVKELPKSTSFGAQKVFEQSLITVRSLSYGDNKNVILECDYSTVDVYSAIYSNQTELINTAYRIYRDEKDAGRMINATKLRLRLRDQVKGYIDQAEPVSGTTTLSIYETAEGKFELYLSDEMVNTCFGGLMDVYKLVSSMITAEYDNELVDIKNNETVRTAINDCFVLVNYDSRVPETGNFVVKTWRSFVYDFNRNFIEAGRWKYLADGLGTTLSITALAGLMGIVLGFVVSIIRCTNQMTGGLVIPDRICRAYLTVIRGTPVMVQLLIIYFVLLLPIGVPKFISAVLCFGLNSGAYVAEIVRGGIMAIDKGQSEAGRSLGFGYGQTMFHFIIPQAFKAVLPALANEFITLLKESSVAFYIGVADLTQGGLKIRSLTYSNYMPLIAVAIIYLVIVMVLTKLVGILERRLQKSER